MRVNYETESDTNVTATTNYGTQQLEHMYGYSVQFTWTCTLCEATLMLQASNNGTDWQDVCNMEFTIGDVGSSQMFVVPEAMYRYVRARVVMDSGTLDTLEIATYIKGT